MNDIELSKQFSDKYQQIHNEISKVIVGQKQATDGLLMALLCNSHALLIGVPGLAKTLLIKTLSQVLDLQFSRIQFTPDLMPSDITGNEILNNERQFQFVKGPLFANIILADEINRTPPKTQAALLEAMQERHLTVSGKSYLLPNPFLVLATQNPIEQEGTYPLPEAQLDRFMLNVVLDYPTIEQEIQIVKNTTIKQEINLNKVLDASLINQFQELILKVPVAPNVIEYAVNLVAKTRSNTSTAAPIATQYLSFGAGPRACQFLILGAKCQALFNQKLSPDIEDVKAVAPIILRHRLVRNYKAEAQSISTDDIINQLM